ncbi:eukaryotic translation initiation factor 3 subunit E [Neodiprion pinetum]|uniref:Eukaryotic translation initiation factor 3 subunit E n=1 Tax=Neodiprion lecontei TaxID=441921 RepID=A0A6J0BM46_NEOLC|nr:eukaryotic translation initiation factor 3 subunit E [Neodiprion lecontei]XP_046435520.1 eukaryotic translation initiation factor 3 subunit E [Neodiprion fabricii]XP_046492191.1 eukaryotic translation initiation factor 3 subunit E [Neodiprion pinetum]XP_046629332.1 eukaryotic translation initiation factor 3 subunit E [Neodiprion virginianus]XP_046751722.1 eukaryotic translation initiation factor 3 subunit E [Diprion similis]
MAKFDLTARIGQYLDRHLVFPLLEFLSAKEIYDENELLQAKLDILSKTNMIDYAIDIRKQLYPNFEVPEELNERRNRVLQELGDLEDNASVILKLMSDDDTMETMEKMRDSKSLNHFLLKESDFRVEMMESLVKLAKYRYECGTYSVSTSYLYFYMLVMPPTDRNYLDVLWGKLASEILVQNWETALEDVNKLREYIDSNAIGNTLQVLQQRTWLIHWSLFVFFNHVKGRDLIIEMFLYRPHYLNAIQTMCPHILRYLATAVIINRSRRSTLKDLVKVIQQESYTYRDPITEFLEHLYVNFDFDGARQKLQECQTVVFNDFFLIALLNEFVENARLMIFETFCRIHQCISIDMLAEKLNMKADVAECWIVNLIRNARLDAKIDSKLGHVVMGGQPASPYQQLVEKIETLSVRSEALENLIERKLKAKNQDSVSIVWN